MTSEKTHDAKNTASDKIVAFFKGVHWETWVFIAILAMIVFVNFSFLSQLKQLPSPLYGGDYYNHLGSINHIYQGGSIFQSGQMLGEIQWVPFLYHVLVVIFAKITGLSTMFANIYFSLVALVAGCIIMYVFVSRFFNNRIYGLLAAILHATNFPLYKYSPFAFFVILPLFFFAGYNFMKKKDWKSALLFGITYGLCGLSNTYVFIVGTFIVGFMLLYILSQALSLHIHEKKITHKFAIDKKTFALHFYLACIVFLVGFAIALLWWFKPIFVYHAHTPNDMQIYGFPDVKGLGGMIGLVITGLKGEFTGYSFTTGLSFTLKKIGLLLGLIALFLLKKKKEEHHFLIIVLLASFFGLFIHFITMPLLGTLMASTGLFNTGLIITTVLLTFLALDVMVQYARKLHKYGEYAVLILFALLLLISINQHFGSITKDYWWTNAGVSPLSPSMVATQAWIMENTDLNDVFLTTNEDGFALNALTGRKVVTYRRTHASPYADMNQRMLDTGIMLHAQNDEDRIELLRKYSVDYIYWQPGWLNNELRFNAQGQLEGVYDPLSIDYTPEREADLIRNNVSYIRTMWYMDPAWLETYPKRDILIIMPGRASYEQPWSPTFDKYLTLQQEIGVNGQLAARIYKVNIPQ
jgi:hypothetical protein